MWWGGSEGEQVGDPPPPDSPPQAASATMEDPQVIKQELGDLKVRSVTQPSLLIMDMVHLYIDLTIQYPLAVIYH